MRYLPLKWPSAALVATLVAVTAATPAQAASAVVGHVYTDANTPTANTIDAFARHADGTLTPLSGSPFAAGGAGTGATIASQGATALDGHYLLAVDAASNQISVLRVHRDGSLSLRSVTSSGGTDPVSIAAHGRLVYVANAGREHPNYTGFRLHRDGTLSPLAHSTVRLPDGSQPGQVLFDPTGEHLVGVRVATSLIDSFSVGDDGRLTSAPGSPYAAQGLGPFGSSFAPFRPTRLYVSNAHGGAGNGSVSAFDTAADGTLTSIGASPFADHQTAPCWVAITPDGEVLFAANTASGSISRYRIAPDGALRLLPGAVSVGGAALDVAISPDGSALYALVGSTHSLAAFALHGADLAPRGAVALPAGATGAGLSVN